MSETAWGLGPRVCVRAGWERVVAAAIFLRGGRPESARNMHALRSRHLCEGRTLPMSFLKFNESRFLLWAVFSPESGFVENFNSIKKIKGLLLIVEQRCPIVLPSMMQMFSVCAVQHSSHWHCKWGACDCGPHFLILILFELNSHMELVIYCVGQFRSKSEYQFIIIFNLLFYKFLESKNLIAITMYAELC